MWGRVVGDDRWDMEVGLVQAGQGYMHSRSSRLTINPTSIQRQLIPTPDSRLHMNGYFSCTSQTR